MLLRLAARASTRRVVAGVAAASATAAASAAVAACEQDEAQTKPLRESTSGRGLNRCRGGEREMGEVYEFLGFLGRGGFGTVRRARHRLSGLYRAIKDVQCDSTEALYE